MAQVALGQDRGDLHDHLIKAGPAALQRFRCGQIEATLVSTQPEIEEEGSWQST